MVKENSGMDTCLEEILTTFKTGQCYIRLTEKT